MYRKVFLLASLLAIAIARPHGSMEDDFEGHHGGGFHHMPEFMKNLGEDAKAELKAIFEDETLTRQQTDEKLQAWAAARGTEAQDAYNKLKTMIQNKMDEIKKKIEESSLSDTIKAAALKVEEIHNDGSLTMKDVREKVKAIYDGLSQEDRDQIHQFMRESMRPKRQAEASSSEEDFEVKGGRRMGFRHMPPFLKSISEEAKAELKAIFEDQTLTRQQFDEKLQAWATAQGAEALEAYNNFKTMMQNKMAEMKTKIEGSSLSDTIKAAALQIEELHNDGSLTMNGLKEKVKAIIDGLSQEDRDQIRQFMHHGKRPRRQTDANEGPVAPNMPAFLEVASETAREAFKNVFEDRSLTKQQIQEKIDNWLAEQGDQVKADFEEMKKKVEGITQSMKEKLAQPDVSENVRAAFEKIEALESNMQLTPDEEGNQVQAIINELPEEAHGEILKVLGAESAIEPAPLLAQPLPVNV